MDGPLRVLDLFSGIGGFSLGLGWAGILERAFTGFAALPPPKSPWEVLGIPVGSPSDVIERAFRAKAMDAHPDRGGSHNLMSELNRAREDALRGVAP